MLGNTKQKLAADALEQLRSGSDIALRIDPDGYESTRLRGNPDADVTIIEYFDFHCPFCQRVQPTLKTLAAEFGDSVRWGFRDLPLTRIHS